MLPFRARRAALARARVVLGAGLLGSLLVACSNGGGGSPAPTLTVTPSSTTAVPGGAAITLHAAGAGGSATTTWTLTGPGTLDTASGTDVVYTPPATTPGNEAATVTITAATGGVSRQAQISLSEVDGPGHHWNVGLPAGVNWTDVEWGGGRFVAVGFDDVATSTDGRTWTHVNTDRISWRSATYGAGAGWVVVGGDGYFLTSADGITWTLQPRLQGRPAPNRIAFGNGVFVGATSGGSLVSSDGKTWTAQDAMLFDVAFGNGVFVGLAQGGPVTSADGRNWPAPAGVGTVPQGADGIAFGNGVFVATSGLSMSTSVDGSHWTPVASPPYSGGHPVFAIDRFFLQYSSASSPDGRTWNGSAPRAWLGAANADGTVVVVTIYDASTTPTNIALASGPGVAAVTPVLAGSMGSFIGIDCGRAGCLAAMSGYAFRSNSRTDWTPFALRSAGGSLEPDVLMHVEPTGSYLVGGLRGNTVTVMTSEDGITWADSAMTSRTGNGASGLALARTPQGLLAVAGFGTLMTSPDGGTWTDVGTLPTGGATAMVFGGGRYVAVAEAGANATSTDGVTWKVGTPVSNSGGVVALLDAVFDGTQFVAVGERGLVATSPDGAAWTLHASASTAWLYAVARAANGELVAVGDQGVVQTSVDGVHWKLRESGTHRWLRAVAATPSGFYAAGEDNLILYSSN